MNALAELLVTGCQIPDPEYRADTVPLAIERLQEQLEREALTVERDMMVPVRFTTPRHKRPESTHPLEVDVRGWIHMSPRVLGVEV